MLRAMVSSIQESLGKAKAELIVTAVKTVAEFNTEQKKEKSRLVKAKQFVLGNSVVHKLVFKDFSENGHSLKLTWRRRDQFGFFTEDFRSIPLLEDGFSINANEYRVFKCADRQQWLEYFRSTEAKASLLRCVSNEIVTIKKSLSTINSCVAKLENLD